MLTIREVIKTFYNALLQRLKKHRGNWEQNDPTADDYIKNRPFYTDENDKTIIIPEQQVAVNSERGSAASGGYVTIPLSPVIEFVVGQSYEIVWNGKSYACTAYEFDGLAAVGNSSMMGGSNTGEPFFIAISKDFFGGAYIYAYTTGTHTVEVSCVKVVKLDKKYLPDLGLAPVATSGNYWDLEELPTIYTDVVRYGTSQSLSTSQKQVARNNIGAVSSSEVTGVVKYTAQELTEEEKAQVRENIGTLETSDIENQIEKAKGHIALIDQNSGYTYIVGVIDGNLVSTIGVKAIAVTTMPSKTEYIHGEYFDTTGMVVTAICQDGTTKELTDYIYTTGWLAEGETIVEITYVEAGITYTDTIPVTVSAFDPAVVLVDFAYTDNGDGTYTITGWNGTYNGETSTEMIIPNYGCIIV